MKWSSNNLVALLNGNIWQYNSFFLRHNCTLVDLQRLKKVPVMTTESLEWCRCCNEQTPPFKWLLKEWSTMQRKFKHLSKQMHTLRRESSSMKYYRTEALKLVMLEMRCSHRQQVWCYRKIWAENSVKILCHLRMKRHWKRNEQRLCDTWDNI